MNKHIITLLLVCSTHASAAMPAEGDSTMDANQSMRVVTFKAVFVPEGVKHNVHMACKY
jgi:hypothetical protein